MTPECQCFKDDAHRESRMTEIENMGAALSAAFANMLESSDLCCDTFVFAAVHVAAGLLGMAHYAVRARKQGRDLSPDERDQCLIDALGNMDDANLVTIMRGRLQQALLRSSGGVRQ